MSPPPASHSGSASEERQQVRPTRASKACRRCHRKKLRCFGGCPCSSCKRAHQSCDFGENDLEGDATLSQDLTGVPSVDARFKQLERIVNVLVSKIDGQSSSQGDRPKYQLPKVDAAPPLPVLQPSPGQFPASIPQVMFNEYPDYSDQISQNNPESDALPLRSQKSPQSRLAISENSTTYGAPLRPPSPACEPVDQLEDFWATLDVRPSLSDDPISAGIIDSNTARDLLGW
jgi:hypothetical protein